MSSLKISALSNYPKIGDTFEEQLLRRALTQFDKKEIDLAQLERAKDEVTRTVLKEQLEAGLEIVTDGQIRWDDPVTYLVRKIKGFTVTGMLRYFDTNTFYRQPVCEAELEAPEELAVRDFQYANTMGSVPVKALMTGPYTMAKLSQNRFYDNLEQFAGRLAAILGEETKRLVRTGATLIQFDEPALLNFKKEFSLFKKIWNRLASHFPEGVEIILSLNYGNLKGIYPEIQELSFTTLAFDYATAVENRRVLKGAPCTKKLLAGVIDSRNTRMETEGEIEGRLEELLQVVPAEDLAVTTNYGLEFLPRENARKKITHLAKVARGFREARVKA